MYLKQKIGSLKTAGFNVCSRILYLGVFLGGGHLEAAVINCSAGFNGVEWYTVLIDTERSTFEMNGMHQILRSPLSIISNPSGTHYITNFGKQFLRLEQNYAEASNTLWVNDEKSAICSPGLGNP